MKIIPSAPEFIREALIVLGGALIAYAVVKMLPDNVQRMFSINNAGSKSA